jgi:hypothetical protein
MSAIENENKHFLSITEVYEQATLRNSIIIENDQPNVSVTPNQEDPSLTDLNSNRL